MLKQPPPQHTPMPRWLGLPSGFILLQKRHQMAMWGCGRVFSNGERCESPTVVKWASDGVTKPQRGSDGLSPIPHPATHPPHMEAFQSGQGMFTWVVHTLRSNLLGSDQCGGRCDFFFFALISSSAFLWSRDRWLSSCCAQLDNSASQRSPKPSGLEVSDPEAAPLSSEGAGR